MFVRSNTARATMMDIGPMCTVSRRHQIGVDMVHMTPDLTGEQQVAGGR